MEKGKEQGIWAKSPSLLPPLTRKQGRGRRAGGGLGRRPWGLVGAWELGERERESRWVVSPFLIWTEVER